MTARHLVLLALLAAATVTTAASQDAMWSPTGQQIGQAGLPAQQPLQQTEPRGAIWGTVVSSGTGQPVDGVRLRLSGAELRGTRTVYSDDDGRFVFVDLPAGAFTLSGSKTGYVSITYGQDRPNTGRPGTPIQLAAGQQVKDLRFELPKGGVITGIVFDEKNRPSVATPVRVLRWTISNGERTLTSAGTATTDDRGIYRVYGLAPGSYVVTAMPRNVTQAADVAMMLAQQEEQLAFQMQMSVGDMVIMREALPVPAQVESEDQPTVGYAPVYYPGTLDLGTASAVEVGVSEELTSVDFALQQVPLSRVEGQVIVPPDMSLSNITVRLYNVDARVPGLNTYSSRARNGSFSFSAVVPGNYRAVATATVRTNRQETRTVGPDGRTVVSVQTSGSSQVWAHADVPVTGVDLSNVMLFLQPGLTVSGRVEFEGGAGRPQGRLRVTLSPLGEAARAAGANSRNANVDENGNFEITGVVPASYQVRASGASGYSLASALLGGIDTLDFPLEVTATDNVSGLTLTFSDQTTQLSGTLQDAMGQPTSAYTVVVFPASSQYWLPQARRIQAARPTTTGQFSFQGLPPGEYRLAAVADVESGIWYDASFLQQLVPASVSVRLMSGQQAVQSLRVGR